MADLLKFVFLLFGYQFQLLAILFSFFKANQILAQNSFFFFVVISNLPKECKTLRRWTLRFCLPIKCLRCRPC